MGSGSGTGMGDGGCLGESMGAGGESQEEGRKEERSFLGSKLRMASLNRCVVKRETLSSIVGIGVDLGMVRGCCA